MVGELAAALPEEGGYYAWVRRALGPFWGVPGGLLSLAASAFDMAIYPTLFVLYLGRLSPALGAWPLAIGVLVIAVVGGVHFAGGAGGRRGLGRDDRAAPGAVRGALRDRVLRSPGARTLAHARCRCA